VGFEKEKRKNGDRRGFLPVWAWTLILGFIVGLVVMGAVSSTRVQAPAAAFSDGSSANLTDAEIYMTATYIIREATRQAEGTQAAAPALYATATAIVQGATATQAAVQAAKP
jgi:hypothetical protein